MTADIYRRLADHVAALEMNPPREGLEEVLKEVFNPLEAEIALALPNNLIPLQPVTVDEILKRVSISREELINVLERLAARGLLFSGRSGDGQIGYALLQRGFGFAQTPFWKGEKTPTAKKMAELLGNTFFKNTAIEQTYGATSTKPFQFIPMHSVLKPDIQAVYSCTMLEKVVEKAKTIAVGHCPCRMRAQLQGRGCNHLLEVCLKFDEMADFLVEREIARPVTKEEALEIIRKSEQDGLVHFVDNALGDVKHNCNCCGCCCWALGPIRRRQIPRDVVMATYFIRETDESECSGCGSCAEVCPVNAITVIDNVATIDGAWCVGCGICVSACPNMAAYLKPKSEQIPSSDFRELHNRIRQEKGDK